VINIFDMRPVLAVRTWLTVGALACAAAADGAAPAFTPVAHSALVTLEAASTPAELTLRLRRTEGTTPLAVTELGVSIDGRSATATARADGSWSVPWPSPGSQGHGRLEVVIAHDGIREVLSGELPAQAAGGGPPAATSGGVLRDHKQMAWWILNIGIVLVAAIAISRRMS
jgi:hypothetical protein